MNITKRCVTDIFEKYLANKILNKNKIYFVSSVKNRSYLIDVNCGLELHVIENLMMLVRNYCGQINCSTFKPVSCDLPKDHLDRVTFFISREEVNIT